MFRSGAITLLAALICGALIGCGGSHAVSVESSSGEPAVAPPGLPADSLPRLQDLPPVDRELSLVGPGWFDIPLGNEYYQLSIHGGTVLPGGVELDATGATAWAIYGVGGFDGDNGPTSARVTAGNVTGEYWVGFSDYENDQWLYAGPFTDSAEAAIPGTSDYPSPNSFVSAAGTCYVAVMVPPDSFARISQLELGVHGGVLGPQPPYNLHGGGGEEALELIWIPSLSANDPDFAGYRLERAPHFYGDFLPVTTELITETFYLDADVMLNEPYRYRLAAEDVSGNRSMYLLALGLGTVPTSQSDPVAILDLPTGPLYGPAEVEFDLSRSYDPAGGTIDTYDIETIGLAPLSGPTDSFAANLQPGCYLIRARVHVGPRNGTTYRTLQVYPQWKENPSTAFITGGALPRLGQLRAGMLPGGTPVFIGYDPTIPGVGVWRRDAAGYTLLPLPLLDLDVPQYICEPVLVGDSLSIALVYDTQILGYTFNSAGGRLSAGLTTSVGETLAPHAALVKMPDDLIGLVYAVESGGVTDLNYTRFSIDAAVETVQDNINAPLTGLDAIYNAESNAIDIMYGEAIATQWRRYQPGLGNLKSAGLANFKPLWLDLEVDPATGRGILAHYYDTVPKRVRYQVLLDDNEIWTTMAPIDDTDDSLWPGDLLGTDSGMLYLGGLDNGGNPVYQLYEFDGSAWSVRNMALSQFQDQQNVALAWEPAATQGWAGGQLPGGATQAEFLLADGSSSIDWTLDSARGQGREMHGAVGADGLHVLYKDVETGLTFHLHSLVGAPWIYEGNPFGTAADLDLGSTSTGEIYASFVTPGNSAELHYWDGNSWAVQQAYPSLAGYRPSLSDQPLQDRIHWAVYIPATTHLRYANGSQTVPFSFQEVTPDVYPVWDGTVNNAGFSFPGVANMLALVGGGMQPGNDIGRYTFPSADFELKLDQASIDQEPEVWGRYMDSSIYTSPAGTTQAFWVAHGENFNSMIYESNSMGENYIELVLGGIEEFLTIDIRRTVTMAYTWGGTAVGLECDLFGTNPVFKWSNFGNWEDLPLPPGLGRSEGGYLSMPELLVGDDGRWHIIYHDYSTDFIMVRSTI